MYLYEGVLVAEHKFMDLVQERALVGRRAIVSLQSLKTSLEHLIVHGGSPPPLAGLFWFCSDPRLLEKSDEKS